MTQPTSAEAIAAGLTEAQRVQQLWHYAEGPVVLDGRSYAQSAELTVYGKPKGIWVSVAGEDDWPSWCRAESFAIERLTFGHLVSLRPDANVLWLQSGADLGRFESQFGREKDWGSWREPCIDWQAVAAQYDGIIIAPYQWGSRLSRQWYYGWDCASGCIWNTAAITFGAPLLVRELLQRNPQS